MLKQLSSSKGRIGFPGLCSRGLMSTRVERSRSSEKRPSAISSVFFSFVFFSRWIFSSFFVEVFFSRRFFWACSFFSFLVSFFPDDGDLAGFWAVFRAVFEIGMGAFRFLWGSCVSSSPKSNSSMARTSKDWEQIEYNRTKMNKAILVLLWCCFFLNCFCSCIF